MLNSTLSIRVTVVSVVCVCLSCALGGCMGPKGATIYDKRAEVLSMRDQAIADLTAREPMANRQLASAAGYAVFSDFGTQFLVVSSGSGYGVAVDNSTHVRTYMRTAGLGAGLGFGVQSYRVVMIFRTQPAYDEFLAVGWNFGGSGSAALQAGGSGSSGAFAASTDPDVVIYQLTETGAMLGASMSGAKFWVDEELNQ